MVRLGDGAQVDARFDLFRDSANLYIRKVHGLCRTCHRLENIFGCTRGYSYMMRPKWMLVLVCLDIVLILTQDRWTVCAKHTTGWEIIVDACNGTPRWRGSSGCSFWSVWRQCQSQRKIGARFAPNVPQAQKSFWTHSVEHLGDVGHVEPHFCPFRDSVSMSAK
jgi:hypothetical protein